VAAAVTTVMIVALGQGSLGGTSRPASSRSLPQLAE
jgi:hypothetical protein